jgi:hypothetical protein
MIPQRALKIQWAVYFPAAFDEPAPKRRFDLETGAPQAAHSLMPHCNIYIIPM